MENNNCLTQFKYKCKEINYEKVGIVGSIDNLKNWNINEPVFLSYNIKDKLFISDQIELPKNKLIEYKYVFHHKDKKIWENLPENRQLIIKENNPLIILDTEEDPNSIKEIKIVSSILKNPKPRKKSEEDPKEEKEESNTQKKKKVKKKGKKPKKDKVNEEEKVKNNLISNDVEDELIEKLKDLDYDSDEKEDINKDKEQKQKEPQQYVDINEDDDIIMCSFNLPFEPIKEKDSFKLKLTNSPLYHILYKVIEKEKNIKWFGSLRDEKNYSKEEREKISEILKEKNMYLFNVDPEIYEKTKILFTEIFEPLCHYITLDENSMDTYVNFNEYWKEYKKYIESVCATILTHISKK